jgi:hypothetical protein
MLRWVTGTAHPEQHHATIWQSADNTVIFRVDELPMDDDGGKYAYHAPTDAAWNGAGINGSHSLMNAVSDGDKKNGLTAGCQLLLDYYRLKAWMAAHPNAQPTDLVATLRRYSVASMEEFTAKARAAICVKYIPERPKSESQADWDRAIVDWCGIAVDAQSGGCLLGRTGFIIRTQIPPGRVQKFTPGLSERRRCFGVELTMEIMSLSSAMVIGHGSRLESLPITTPRITSASPRSQC